MSEECVDALERIISNEDLEKSLSKEKKLYISVTKILITGNGAYFLIFRYGHFCVGNSSRRGVVGRPELNGGKKVYEFIKDENYIPSKNLGWMK